MARRQSARTLDLAKRDARALQLFQLGKTYQQIADAKWKDGTLFNGDRGNCYRTIRKLIKEVTREPAEEARTEELLRLDSYLQALSPAILRGDVRAIQTAIKLGEQRAKLLGLYEPTKIETSGDGQIQVVFSAALQAAGGMNAVDVEVEPVEID